MLRTPSRTIQTVALVVCLLPKCSLAESLQVFRGDPDHEVTFVQSTSVIVRSPKTIAEMSVGNVHVVDPAHVSRNEVALRGVNEGRTTLTLLYDTEDGSFAQVNVLVTPNEDSAIRKDNEGVVVIPPIHLPPSPAPEVITVQSGVAVQEIPLAAHQSIVLKTDTPFTQIVAADPEIAAVTELRDGEFAYVIGMSAGSTTLTLQRDGGAASTQLTVVVSSPD